MTQKASKARIVIKAAPPTLPPTMAPMEVLWFGSGDEVTVSFKLLPEGACPVRPGLAQDINLLPDVEWFALAD